MTGRLITETGVTALLALLAQFTFMFLLSITMPIFVFWSMWYVPLDQVWWLPLVTLILLLGFWAVHRWGRHYKDVAFILLLSFWTLFGSFCMGVTVTS